MGDEATQTALLDPDLVSRVEVDGETPDERDTRQAALAARLAGFMTSGTKPVEQPVTLDLTAAALGAAQALASCETCSTHTDDDGHEPCDACQAAAAALGTQAGDDAALGTVVIVQEGDADTATPAPVEAPSPTVDEAAADPTAADGATPALPMTVEIDPKNPGRFRSVLCVEGERSADDRIMDPGAGTWRQPPLTFALMVETQPGHMGARAAAVIEEIHREGMDIVATGRFDTGEDGLAAAHAVANELVTGVSIDMGNIEVDYEVESVDADGYPDKVLVHYTAYEILMATICPAQAIGSAHVEYIAPESLSASVGGTPIESRVFGTVEWLPPDGDPLTAAETVDALIATATPNALTAGIGVTFPAAAFDDPRFEAPSPLRVYPDGTFTAHLALWGECHTGSAGACVLAPRSRTGYAYFQTGYVQTDQGERPVGTVTLATVHAGYALGLGAALAHYDDTGLSCGYANVGEDRFGIWIAGVLKPGLSDAQVTEFTASKMSGDWRDVRDNLELAAVLGVNTPGFPVARVVNGKPKSLVAAIGPVRPTETLAAAEIRATTARLEATTARLDDMEARLRRTEERLAPIMRDHLASRLTTS